MEGNNIVEKELIGINNKTAISSHNIVPAMRELKNEDVEAFVNSVKTEKEKNKPIEKSIEKENKKLKE